MPEVTPIHGGKASMEDRAEAARQAGFYEVSQRKSDLEHMAQSEGKPGGGALFFIWMIGVAMVGGGVAWGLS